MDWQFTVEADASAAPEAKRHEPSIIQSVSFHLLTLTTGLCGLSLSVCVSEWKRGRICYFLSADRNTEQKLRARRSGSILSVSPSKPRTRSLRRWILIWTGRHSTPDWPLKTAIEWLKHLSTCSWRRRCAERVLRGFALLRIGWICAQEGWWRHLSWLLLLYRFCCRCHVLEM